MNELDRLTLTAMRQRLADDASTLAAIVTHADFTHGADSAVVIAALTSAANRLAGMLAQDR